MKKYTLLMTASLVLILNSCALGGIIEADQLEGTWVSDNFYSTSSQSYYVYYDFNSLTVDLDGDQTGKYRIRGYNDTFWWDTNFQALEEGTYMTDFIFGKITLVPYYGPGRVLNYSLSNNSLVLTDNDWWTSSSIVLRKL